MTLGLIRSRHYTREVTRAMNLAPRHISNDCWQLGAAAATLVTCLPNGR
jgi:hypothetical protein